MPHHPPSNRPGIRRAPRPTPPHLRERGTPPPPSKPTVTSTFKPTAKSAEIAAMIDSSPLLRAFEATFVNQFPEERHRATVKALLRQTLETREVPPQLKPVLRVVARRLTAVLVAVPVAIVSSYWLWQRVVQGKEQRRRLPRERVLVTDTEDRRERRVEEQSGGKG